MHLSAFYDKLAPCKPCVRLWDLSAELEETNSRNSAKVGQNEGKGQQIRNGNTRLYLTMTVLVTVILLCSLGFTLAMDIARERRALDRRITEAATYVAELRGVRKMLEAGYPDTEVTEQLEAITEFVSGIDSILIADSKGLRFYQTSRHMAGDMFVDGDEARILKGTAPYITTVDGTGATALCLSRD